MEEQNRSQPAILANLPPSYVFIGGIVAGFLVLCTIGFFVLLGFALKGGVSFGGTKTTLQATGAVAPSPVQPPAPVATGPIRAVDDKRDHILGPKNAKVTFVEYSDFQCPFCGDYAPTVKQVLANYSKDVRLVYRHLPLRSLHPQAASAAEASECANEQGKFWEFHDALFANQARLGPDLYTELAQTLKLNVRNFSDCVSAQKYASRVQEDENDALGAGINGTPQTVLIGPDGKATNLRGVLDFTQLKSVIDQLLKA